MRKVKLVMFVHIEIINPIYEYDHACVIWRLQQKFLLSIKKSICHVKKVSVYLEIKYACTYEIHMNKD